MLKRHFSVVNRAGVYHTREKRSGGVAKLNLDGILRGERIPVHYVDPFQAVGIKHNYRREFWAEKGKALSSLRLRKLCTEAFGLIEHIASHRNRRYYAQAILHCDRLNAIFLECLCIEDQRVMAAVLFDHEHGIIEHVIDLLGLGDSFGYILIRLLYNLSYCIEARLSMVALSLFEVLAGLLRIGGLELSLNALELIENLTDQFTPQLQSPLLTKGNIRCLESLASYPTQDLLVLSPCLVVIVERMVMYGPAQQLIYRNGDTFSRCTAALRHALSETMSSSQHQLAALARIQKHLSFIEKRHGLVGHRSRHEMQQQ